MKIKITARLKLANLSESQIENKPFTVGKVNFNNVTGLGSVSDCANIVYMGIVAMMKPSNFLRLASEGKNLDQVASLKAEILKGTAIGSPFLSLNDDIFEETGMFRVSGHEGRHRCYAIQEIQGDQPIPVCIFIYGFRARNFTPKVLASLKENIRCQRSTLVASGVFESICVDGVWQ